jgi:hypothetical protein
VKPLAIQTLGAFTPVGEDVKATLAGLYTDVRLLRDLDTKGGSNQPRMGAVTPLDRGLTGCKRLFELGRRAFLDAAYDLPNGTVLGIALCAPLPTEEPGVAEDFPSFCARLAAEGGLTIEPRASRVFALGRSGVIEALGFAQTALYAQTASAICLLGADSFITKSRLGSVGRGTSAARGWSVPGEAAAAVCLAGKADIDTVALVAGFASADEPSLRVSPPPPNLGRGLASAIANAALDAQLGATPIAGLVHDLPASSAAREELAWAKGCPVFSVPTDMPVLGPSISVGEAGAAMGVLALVALGFLIDKRVVNGPGLCLFSTEGPRRGAAVLLPSPCRA